MVERRRRNRVYFVFDTFYFVSKIFNGSLEKEKKKHVSSSKLSGKLDLQRYLAFRAKSSFGRHVEVRRMKKEEKEEEVKNNYN